MVLKIEKEIKASADAVWNIIGKQFVEIDEWFSFVKKSETVKLSEVPSNFNIDPNAPVIGRRTTTKATLTEVLTYYSDNERKFTFLVTDMPKFMMSKSANTTSVAAINDNKSKVTTEVELVLKFPFSIMAPVLKSRMLKMQSKLMVELAQYAETGQIFNNKK